MAGNSNVLWLVGATSRRQRAATAALRVATSAAGTSHQDKESEAEARGSVSATTTVVSSLRPALADARANFSRVVARSTCAPRLAATGSLGPSRLLLTKAGRSSQQAGRGSDGSLYIIVFGIQQVAPDDQPSDTWQGERPLPPVEHLVGMIGSSTTEQHDG